MTQSIVFILVGQEGAVGAFISDDDGAGSAATSFAGAIPPMAKPASYNTVRSTDYC